MKILAVEFSSECRSVAVMQDGEILGRAAMQGGRESMVLIEKALLESRCEREEIGTIAVGLGPGSYTGIRGAIALAQGWQLGRGVNLLGISSVDCLVTQAQRQKCFGPVSIVIDAQRNEFYLARYEVEPGAIHPVAPLRLAAHVEIMALAAAKETLVGPEIVRCFSTGLDLYPDASVLGQLAAKRTDFLSGDKLEPIYLRETAFKKAPPPRLLP